jgi:hypothetical protein
MKKSKKTREEIAGVALAGIFLGICMTIGFLRAVVETRKKEGDEVPV